MSDEVKDVVEEVEDLELDHEHGFQNEPGFEIDGVVGELKLTVILCHSARNPQPKERVVMRLPDGSVRVHDHVGVARAHGHQIVHDRWSAQALGIERVVTFVRRLFQSIEVKAIEKLISKLK